LANKNEIITQFTAEFAKFDKSLATIEKKLNGLDGTTQKADKGFKGFTQSLNKNFGAIAIGIGTITGAVIAINNFSQAATDAEETSSKFLNTFNSNATKASQVAADLANSFGLADSEAQKLLANTGDLVIGFGATDEQALALSERVNRLAIDLASYTNIEGGAERASQALTSAMLGEREAAKSLGIVITETQVKEELRKKGLEGLKGEALLLAKAEATMDIAYRQSTNAIGDYVRTSESAANVSRRLNSAVKEARELMGAYINDVLTPIKNKLADFISRTNLALRAQRNLNKAIAGDEGANILLAVETQKAKLQELQEQFDGNTKSAEASTSSIIGGYTRQTPFAQKRIEEETKILKQLEEELAKNLEIEKNAARKEAQLAKEVEAARLSEEEKTAIEQQANNLRQFERDILLANLTESEKEAVEEYNELLKEKLAEEEAINQARVDSWKYWQSTVLDSVSTVAGAFGEALVLGEDAWSSFGATAVNAVAGIVSALGKAMQVKSAEAFADYVASFFTAIPKLSASLKYASGAILAETVAGAIRGSAKANFQTGTADTGFTVPEGFNNDNFNIGVSSGERVFVENASQQAASSNLTSITLDVIMDSKVFWSATQKGIDANKIRFNVR